MEQFTQHAGGIGPEAKKRPCCTMAGPIGMDAPYFCHFLVQ